MFWNRFVGIKRCFSTKTLNVEDYKAVTVIGLNRPEQQNAFTTEMVAELSKTFNDFESNPNTRVAVVHGVGGNFSTGYDLDDVESELKNCNNLNKFLVSEF